MDYEVIDGKMVATPQFKIKRFIAKYPEIFQSKSFDVKTFKSVYEQIPQSADFVVVSYDRDLMNYSLMSLLFRNSAYEDTLVINAYTLLEIYLGKSEDWVSISDIENKIVCVYLGYSEFENRRQSDIIEQLIEQQRVHNKKFWLFYKGSDIKEKYPKLIPLIEANGGLIYKLSFAKSVQEEEEF